MASLPLATWRTRLLLLCACSTVCVAQESPTPTPTTTPAPSVVERAPVTIRFVPPPLEGTISLGIYDATGKLVRVLQREADIEQFKIGHDALSLEWDGKDDRETPLPPGKYRARGFAVGDAVNVDGVGFFFNDWVTEEGSPRIEKVLNLRVISGNDLAMLVALPGGKEGSVTSNLNGELQDDLEEDAQDERFLPERYSVRASEGKLRFHRAEGWQEVHWPELVAPQDAAAGKDKSVWVIDRVSADSSNLVLKQFSADGAFLREMAFAPEEPKPKIIAASTVTDKIFLLEENDALQRVRGLTLSATTPASEPANPSRSDWKVDFEKKIVRHQNFTIVNGQPVVSDGAIPPTKIAIKLTSNPLQKDKTETLEVSAGYDAESSFIQTTDGLPLQTISETSNLQRILLSSQSEKTVDVFQDDGAVVEQFRVSGLDQIMAFDCGEIQLK